MVWTAALSSPPPEPAAERPLVAVTTPASNATIRAMTVHGISRPISAHDCITIAYGDSCKYIPLKPLSRIPCGRHDHCPVQAFKTERTITCL